VRRLQWKRPWRWRRALDETADELEEVGAARWDETISLRRLTRTANRRATSIAHKSFNSTWILLISECKTAGEAMSP